MTPEQKQIQKRRKKRIDAFRRSYTFRGLLLPLTILKVTGRLLLWVWRSA